MSEISLLELKTLIEGMQTQMNNRLDGLGYQFENFNHEMNNIKRKNLKLELENKELKTEVSVLKSEVYRLSSIGREKNLILFNIQDDDTMNTNLVENIKKILQECNIIIPENGIAKAERIGNKEDKRPICLTLTDAKHKKTLYDKTSELKKKRISISNDLSEWQRKERSKLIKTQNLLKVYGIDCKIKGVNLMIDNTEYDIKAALNMIQNLNQDSDEDSDYSVQSQKSNNSRKRGRKIKDNRAVKNRKEEKKFHGKLPRATQNSKYSPKKK